MLVCLGVWVLLALGACSPGSTDAPDEARQDRLVFRDEMRAYHEDLARCLTDLGFPYEVYASGDGMRPAGHPGAGSGSDNREAYLEASTACDASVGPHPEIPVLDAEDIAAWYDQLVQVGQCLQANGFPSPEPMSREAYVETYLASLTGATGPPQWSPYQDQPPGAEELAACPEPSFADIYYGTDG